MAAAAGGELTIRLKTAAQKCRWDRHLKSA